MAAEIEELKAENQRLRDEISGLKDITEPVKEYFHRDGFTLAVNPPSPRPSPPRTSRATSCWHSS
eukprot:1227834-Pleurochrysis_carterae.AAC.2